MGKPRQRTAGLASLLRLRQYVHPYRWQIILMIAAGILISVVDIVVPLLTRAVVDGPIAHGSTGELIPLGLLAVLFTAIESGLILLRRWTVTNSALGVETDMRNDLYRKLQSLPVAFHDRWQSGQLVARMASDMSTIRRFVGFAFVFLVVNTVTCVIVGTVLIVIDPLLGVIVVAMAIPLLLLMLRGERRYRRQIRAVQDQQGEVATDVEESALGIRAIKAFGRRPMMFDRFDGKSVKLRDLQMRQIRTLADLWAVVMAQPTATLGLLVLFGAVAVRGGVLSLGTLIAYLGLFQLSVWPVESMGWLLANAQEAASAAERVYEVLDAEVAIADPAEPASLPETTRGRRVAFEHVTFRYPGAGDGTAAVIDGLDLVIEPGETLALVGATGCGKTTLTSLVPRLYDVTGGRVTIDGVDVRELPLAELRRDVSCAFEEPTLFSASVRENVLLGRPDATEDDLREALRIAQADFVDELPWGLDTRVGEQGMTLSGGQRQRLALARAVLGRPPVLVLDDPLSALDVHTEGLVESELRRVLSGTTALVVAHRPSTVLLADRVALMADGRVAALGTHHELLETVPAYRDILSQTSDLDAELLSERVS